MGKFLLIGLSSLLVTLILTDLFFKRLEGLRGIWGLAEGKLRARLARGYAENIRAGYGPEVEAMQPTLARGTRNLTGSLAALSFSTAPVTGALID
ncbi:hypothetical protein EPA93_28665 [Ktedonosporobacter rubrisoli]|uniref:Uncharacterized protein n=1 Tax=Ktedonosporobacter rubrisoli TaxID=2509675 RepID=A0A4P6JVP7_KTERU|nr:hypothetical protein [Ktedonosporobacter rubrisoli]QBD79737.1 hypothetical protein EPA93_28665 [Ktedonosporobacter rubrisoli]